MHIVLSIVGVCLGFALLKFRQQVGDMMGEADFMRFFGGVYNFVIIVGIFLILWSIGSLFGVQDVFFRPLLMLFPHRGQPVADPNFLQ